MTDEQLKKLEQWSVVMTLMGFDQGQQSTEYEEYDNDDNHSLYDTICHVIKLQKRMKDPDPWMAAALQTIEMGVNDDEIYEYCEHLEKLEEEALCAEMAAKEAANPEIVRLMTEFNFRLTQHKRYKNHTCWEFNTSNGIVVQGRSFKPSWNSHRVWLSWTDTKGKKQIHKWNPVSGDFKIPMAFPQDWREWYGYTGDPIKQAKIISWLMATKQHKRTGFPAIK